MEIEMECKSIDDAIEKLTGLKNDKEMMKIIEESEEGEFIYTDFGGIEI